MLKLKDNHCHDINSIINITIPYGSEDTNCANYAPTNWQYCEFHEIQCIHFEILPSEIQY